MTTMPYTTPWGPSLPAWRCARTLTHSHTLSRTLTHSHALISSRNQRSFIGIRHSTWLAAPSSLLLMCSFVFVGLYRMQVTARRVSPGTTTLSPLLCLPCSAVPAVCAGIFSARLAWFDSLTGGWSSSSVFGAVFVQLGRRCSALS